MTLFGQEKRLTFFSNFYLYLIFRGGRIKDAKELIDEGLHVDAYDFNSGNTALHAAVLLRDKDFVIYLLEKGANANMKNRRGQTPLHLAVENRQNQISEILILQGKADAKLPDNMGKSAYELAGVIPTYQLEIKSKKKMKNFQSSF